jgi:hypothetical protein
LLQPGEDVVAQGLLRGAVEGARPQPEAVKIGARLSHGRLLPAFGFFFVPAEAGADRLFSNSLRPIRMGPSKSLARRMRYTT